MINTNEALKILEDAHALAEKLNGLDEANIEHDRQRSAVKAQISNQLLYLAHLCDVARVEAMNQYHVFKGKQPPSVTAPPDELVG